MKAAIVRFSDLGNRMDAGFHILRESLREETAKIESNKNPEDVLEEARDAFFKMPPSFRKCLEPLIRTGSNHSPSVEQYERAIAEYPAFSLAIMQQHYEQIRAYYEEQAKDAAEKSKFFKKD